MDGIKYASRECRESIVEITVSYDGFAGGVVDDEEAVEAMRDIDRCTLGEDIRYLRTAPESHGSILDHLDLRIIRAEADGLLGNTVDKTAHTDDRHSDG